MTPLAPGREPSRALVATLLVLACVPYLLGLGEPPLWDANEPLYAEPPREVLETGEWLVPTWNYVPWKVRPPLATWVTVPFYAAFGVSPFSARLPMALAAVATLLATCSLGTALGGRRTGLFAALVLASTARYWLFSRQLAGDVYLAAAVVGAFALAAPVLRGPAGAHRRRLLAAHALVAVGVLLKGPVILALYAVPLALAARLARPRVPFRSLRPVALGVLTLLLAAPWFVHMAWVHEDYLRIFFGHHHVRRAVSDDVGARPAWFLLQALAGDGQPWVLLLPFAAWAPFASRAARVAVAPRSASALDRLRAACVGAARTWRARREAGRGRARDPLAVLAWAAALFPLVLFSIPFGKRNVYLLPAYPMMAVAIAPFVAQAFDGLHPRLVRGVAVLAALASAAGVAMLVAARGNAPDDVVGATTPWLVGCVVAVVVFTGAAARASGRTLTTALVVLPLWAVTVAAFLFPALARYRPVPRLARTLVAQARPGDAAVVYGVSVHSLMFYAERRTTVARNPAELLAAIPPGGRALVLGQDDEVAALVAVPRARLVRSAGDPRLPALEVTWEKTLPVRVTELDRAPYLLLQFSRNVLGRDRSVRDLVLVAVERDDAGGPRAGPR
ncbi:MAG: glycosyltransferase family 39 protein [Planctomycetes bacterium]|nr:glycosyltransferase family 39 protein [Planctomycetota bacterium]